MKNHYWAVKPAGDKTTERVRLAKATTADAAVREAFGVPLYESGSRLAEMDRTTWLVKDLGTRISAVQTNKTRIALLTSTDGWEDPYKLRGDHLLTDEKVLRSETVNEILFELKQNAELRYDIFADGDLVEGGFGKLEGAMKALGRLKREAKEN